jgi:ribosomal protein L11 methyltransferase
LVLRSSNALPPGHPSTRLCLELLVAACREQSPTSLLDVGCGSGVLALAGAQLGIPCNVGIDISGAALRVARDNARQNLLTKTVHWLKGSTEAIQAPFDLIIANLPWALQIDKVEEFLRLSHPQTTLILSGFRDTQDQFLQDLYLRQGWQIRQRLCKDLWELELPLERSYTWVGLCLKKSTGPIL